jgi:hypothetical protein
LQVQEEGISYGVLSMRSMHGGLFPIVGGPCKRYDGIHSDMVTVTVSVTRYLFWQGILKENEQQNPNTRSRSRSRYIYFLIRVQHASADQLGQKRALVSEARNLRASLLVTITVTATAMCGLRRHSARPSDSLAALNPCEVGPCEDSLKSFRAVYPKRDAP